MKDYYDKKTGKCKKEDEYTKNKKERYCKECIHNIVVCRFSLDEKY